MTPTLLLISGSLRAGSVNEAALRTAQQLAPDPLWTNIIERGRP